MHSPSELADWWDKNKKESEKALEAFVDAHPHWWAAAATVQTCMDVGAGFVDVLRFGEGMAESYNTGKVWPLVQDLFRGLTIAGGAAKLLGSAAVAGRVGTWIGRGTNIGGKLPGLYADVAPARGICAPIATANAIRRTGNALMLNKNLMLSLDEVAIAHGRTAVLAAENVSMEESIAALKALKVAHEVIPEAGSWENVARLAQEQKGVMMIRIMNKTGEIRHRVVLEAFEGGVRIIDRSGIYNSLEQLSARYAGVLKGAKWVVNTKAQAVLVKTVTVRLINGLPTLMAYVNAFLPKLRGETTVQQLDSEFQKFKAQAIHLTPPNGAGHGASVTVRPGDTLSGLAAKHYHAMDLWPLVWDANRTSIPNPNRITPGMALVIPPLSSFSAAQLADARRRHPSWRSYQTANAR